MSTIRLCCFQLYPLLDAMLYHYTITLCSISLVHAYSDSTHEYKKETSLMMFILIHFVKFH